MKLVFETLAVFITTLLAAALVALGEPARAEIALTEASSAIVDTGFEAIETERQGR